MAAKQIRKTSQKIKDKILSQLKEGPFSIKRLSEKIGSNWSTVKEYLKELEDEGKVREMTSLDSGRYYVRSDYPTFYGLPLDSEKLKKSLYLLSKITERWNVHKKNEGPIAKTPLQKIAVDLIQKNKLDIPVVRFHYGKVLVTRFEPEKSQEIISIYGYTDVEISDREIDKEIRNRSNLAWKEKKKQYETHPDMKIFNLSDEIYYTLSKNKTSNPEKILDMFYELLLEFPVQKEYSILFSKYYDLLGAIKLISNSEEFGDKENRRNFLKEILETFDSIWQALTTEFFFQDVKPFISKEFVDLFEFIKESKTQSYYVEVEERLNNLLDYKMSLAIKEIKLDETEEKMLNIFLEGADEE